LAGPPVFALVFLKLGYDLLSSEPRGPRALLPGGFPVFGREGLG